jgi:hypothetical protein
MQTIMRHTVLTRHFQGLSILLCRRGQDMKKLLLAALIVLSIVSVSGRAYAGDNVILDTFVTQVAAYNDRENGFWIQTSYNISASRIPCAAIARGIIFPANTPSSPEAHKQAFSIALTAFLANKPVDIYSYDPVVTNPNGQCVGHVITLKR